MQQNILTINAGSSSLKCAVFRTENGRVASTAAFWTAQIDFKPGGRPNITWQGSGGAKQSQAISSTDRMEATKELFELMFAGNSAPLSDASAFAIVGHRVVHGGAKYTASAVITDTVIADLRACIELAPLHEPANIEGIELALSMFKDIKHIAVFDTAFHRTIPDSARVYAGPYSWYEKLSIQRFGFHGISHQYCAAQAGTIVGQNRAASRIVTCHVGNGASLTAVKDGKSIMTTMGFTPLDGLVMGTRCGSIDPGILVHLLEHRHCTIAELDDLLNHQSGLKGISGSSSDMRDIEKSMAAGDQRAKLAFDIYVERLAASIASVIPALGGLDILVFAGGVGENSVQVRSATCSLLGFLGVEIDPEKNVGCKSDGDISAAGAPVATLVIHTKEDFQIATECLAFMVRA